MGMMATSYYKPSNVKEVAAMLMSVANLAPHFPLYYYHIPMMNAVDVNVEEVMNMANAQCPNVLGVKYTAGDIAKYTPEFFKKYNVLNGFDPNVFGGIKAGADGAIGIGFNFYGDRAFEIYHAV